jgi:hypothetical protein
MPPAWSDRRKGAASTKTLWPHTTAATFGGREIGIGWGWRIVCTTCIQSAAAHAAAAATESTVARKAIARGTLRRKDRSSPEAAAEGPEPRCQDATIQVNIASERVPPVERRAST